MDEDEIFSSGMEKEMSIISLDVGTFEQFKDEYVVKFKINPFYKFFNKETQKRLIEKLTEIMKSTDK